MRILSVIPLKKGILKGDLTYFTSLDVAIGSIVSVQLRSKETLALVTSSEELKDAKGSVKEMDFNLKKVTRNRGASIFLKEFLETIFDTSTYFAQNKNIAITSLIPSLFIEKYDTLAKIKNNTEREQGEWLKTEKSILQYPLIDRISMYKTLVRESFAKGKSVFMVLPTESDIDSFTNYLSKGIEQFTFPISSKLSAKKNLATYEHVITSTHPVLIIGTPPFLSIPRKDIGTIILEHEYSSAYRMQRRPNFDLRVFTEIYTSKINAKFIVADDMLRFETIGRKEIDNLNPLHPLSFRIDFDGSIEVLGKNSKTPGQKFQILKDESVDEIKSALESKKNVFIFSLRKGLATMTVCKDCGESVTCDTCGAPLVLYISNEGKKRTFACNRCQTDKGADIGCASCGSWNLMPLGIGTDTVYEEVEKLFPNREKIKIFKLDKESAKTAAGAKKIIKEFEETPGSILIGTEMAFFYLKNKVSLSIIASFDSLWSIPNFKMSEKIIHIVLGMAKHTTEKIIIQTKNDNDKAILAIKSGNLLSFVREELEDRKTLAYPPYKRFIKIMHLGDKEETTRAREILKEMFAEHNPEIFSGFISRLRGKYLTNTLIKIEPQKWSLPELSLGSSIDQNLLAQLLSLPMNFEILIDPEDLL